MVDLRRSLQTLTPELRRTEVVSSTTIPPQCQPAIHLLAPNLLITNTSSNCKAEIVATAVALDKHCEY